jgi:hypothetical protein
MLNRESMDVNYGIQTFNSSIRSIKWSMIDTGSLLGVGFTLLGATFCAGVVLVGKGLKSVKPEIVTFVQCAVR